MTRTPPLVSVIIPAYNPGPRIAEAIDSALDQTYETVEVIVVDDASTENLAALLEAYGGRITAVRLKKNQGPSAARNEGIRLAKGKYIAFLDADDWWESSRLEKLVGLLEGQDDVGIVTSDILDVFDGKPANSWYSTRQTKFRHEDQASSFIKAPFFPPCHAVYRKELFDRYGGFDEEFMRGEDWDLGIRMLVAGERAAFHPEILSYFRKEKGSLTTWGPWEEDRVRLLEKWQAKGVPRAQRPALEQSLARARWDLAKKRIDEGHRAEASPLLNQVIRRGPLELKLKAALLMTAGRPARRIPAIRRNFLMKYGAPHSLALAAKAYSSQGASAARGFVAAVVLQGEDPPKVRGLAAMWIAFPPLRRWISRALLKKSSP